MCINLVNGRKLKTIVKVAKKRNKISFAGTIFCYDDVVFLGYNCGVLEEFY